MHYDPSEVRRRQFKLHEFHLENGAVISDFILSYIVQGASPAEDGSNVILITSSLGGDAHRLDFLIGETLALSPEKYCLICVDAIGNGHTSSPSNHRERPGQNFPDFSILDMVQSQKRLLEDVFGLSSIQAVAGASMGGMQALQWAVSYPDDMRAIIAMVPLAKTPPWTQLTHETARRIVMADPAWANGQYENRGFDGWRSALALTQALVPHSPQYAAADIQDTDPVAWLNNLIEQAIAYGMDPNDWIFQSRAYDRFDLGQSAGFDGNTEAALASIKAKVLILGSETDLLNPIADQRAAAAPIPKARFKLIPSERGHMAANIGDQDDVDFMNSEVSNFLTDLPPAQSKPNL